MAGIILFTNPMSRGCIPLDAQWTGQPYETGVRDYGLQMKSPDYLAINSMGKSRGIANVRFWRKADIRNPL